MNKLNVEPSAQNIAEVKAKGPKEEEVVKRLRIFHGIKVVSFFYELLGLSFVLSWYAFYNNMQEIENKKHSVWMVLVYGSMYTVPILFITAGFLQTHSFLQGDQTKIFSAGHLAKYYLWRITKFLVVEIVTIAFAMYIITYFGQGPIWPTYETVMAPCNKYWWTVPLQINNFYPANFDDKCLPFLWFFPALTQVSLLLPIILLVYKLAMPNRTVVRIIYGLLIVGTTIICYIITYSANVGAIPFAIVPIAGITPLNDVSFDYFN